MLNDNLIRLYKDDWLRLYPTNFYQGKFRIGGLILTNFFILDFMEKINVIDINSILVTSDLNNLENDMSKITYMEMSGLLSKSILNKIREIVKNPPSYIHIFIKNIQLQMTKVVKNNGSIY